MRKLSKNWIIIISVILVTVVTGCKDEKMKLTRLLKNFESRSINLPESLLRICDSSAVIVHPDNNIPILVMYIGPEDCSSCAVSHLREKVALFDLSVNLRSFSLNSDGYPVFVGNPLRSAELMQVFLQSL